jgi:hypothetical protein
LEKMSLSTAPSTTAGGLPKEEHGWLTSMIN